MIYITSDCNFWHISYDRGADYTKFYMNKQFNKMIELTEEKSLRDEISVVVSEVVIKELVQQKLEAFVETCERIRELSDSIGEYGYSEIMVSQEDYKEILCEQVNEYLEQCPVIFMPVCKNEHFSSIVDRAIQKKPPFEGADGKADKGFKDVLIWYSMLDFATKCTGEYFFITNDNIFQGENKKELIKEFRERTGCKLHICRNVEDILADVRVTVSKKPIDSVDVNYKIREIILRHTDNRFSAKLKYVQPVLFAVDDVLNYINQDIKKIYDDALSYWEGIDLGKWDNEDDSDYAGEMESTITYNKNGKLGLLFSGDIYLGGCHGSPSQIGRVYDLNTGKVLGLEELLNKDEDTILKMICEKCEADKRVKSSGVYWEDFQPSYKSLEEVNFYLSEQGIHVFFDVYEAGCYASGFIEFILAGENEVVVR